MKKLIRSSTKKVIKASNSYTDRFTYNRSGHTFSVYTKDIDDPENFQCSISEIKPYDLANYYSIKKDIPNAASLIRNSKRVGAIELRRYIEDDYEDPNEYINYIIDYLCTELIGYNRSVRPKIDRS